MGHKRTPVQFEPYVLSVADAAKFSGCGVMYIWKLIREGKLDVRKDGRRTLVMVASLKKRLDALPRG
jgi:excisionase family DNA binding protein